LLSLTGLKNKVSAWACLDEAIESLEKMSRDGAKSYRALKEKNVCSTAAAGSEGFYRLNEVNGYHSVIKGSKSRRGNGGTSIEIEAQSEDIAIDVLGPTLFTQPEIKLRKP
jgi:hypothetical protein